MTNEAQPSFDARLSDFESAISASRKGSATAIVDSKQPVVNLARARLRCEASAPMARKLYELNDELIISNEIDDIFRPVENSLTNLIAITGKLGEGKSFLMNASGQRCISCQWWN